MKDKVKVRNIGVAGSTGSIGTQTLEVVRRSKGSLNVSFLSCNNSIELMAEQIIEFFPDAVSLPNREKADLLRTVILHKIEKSNSDFLKNFSSKDIPEILIGEEGIREGVSKGNFEVLINGIMGIAGLAPTYFAVKSGKNVALANKEALVAGGHIIMPSAREANVEIIPVDSEHSAIYQCLAGNKRKDLKKILLTGSGGPFRGKTMKELESVSVQEALNHPNWRMGKKITVDSATLMNKGLEYIEAKWFFEVKAHEIEVIIHKESFIHSAVEFTDGSIIAQMGTPDMKLPISYALTKPARCNLLQEPFSPVKVGCLTFEEPDLTTFKCLKMAMDAAYMEDSYSVVLNSANEVLVDSFLKGNLEFLGIQKWVEKILDKHIPQKISDLESILALDKETRELVERERKKVCI